MRASLRCISPRVMRRRSTFFFQIFAAAFIPPAIAFQLMSRMRTDGVGLVGDELRDAAAHDARAEDAGVARPRRGVAATGSFFDSSIRKKRRMRFCATSPRR